MRPERRRNMLTCALAAAVVAALAAAVWPVGAITPVTIYECDLTATFVQATTVSKDTYDVDPKIPKDIKTDLIAKYGHKYMKYSCIRSENFLLTWDPEDKHNKDKKPVRTAEVTLPDGKKLIMLWMSFDRTHLLLKFQFQTGTSFSMPDIYSGANMIVKLTEDPNPVILVISPKLITTTK